MLIRRVGPVEGRELQRGPELVDDRLVFRNAETLGSVDRIVFADVADVLHRLHDEDHGDEESKVLFREPEQDQLS